MLQDYLDASEVWFKTTFSNVSDTQITIFFVGWLAFIIGSTVWVFRADQNFNEEVNDEKLKAESRKTK